MSEEQIEEKYQNFFIALGMFATLLLGLMIGAFLSKTECDCNDRKLLVLYGIGENFTLMPDWLYPTHCLIADRADGKIVYSDLPEDIVNKFSERGTTYMRITGHGDGEVDLYHVFDSDWDSYIYEIGIRGKNTTLYRAPILSSAYMSQFDTYAEVCEREYELWNEEERLVVHYYEGAD